MMLKKLIHLNQKYQITKSYNKIKKMIIKFTVKINKIFLSNILI